MSLSSLPPELLNMIVDEITDCLDGRTSPLTTLRTLFALSHACRYLWVNLTWRMYRLDAERLSSSALVWAATKGIRTTAEQSLAQGGNLRATNQHNQPLLWLAARYGHWTIVQLLLSRGVDHETKGPKGLTPLAIAAREGQSEMTMHLIHYGADIEAKSAYESTPLLWAIRAGATDAVDILLDHGAELPPKHSRAWRKWAVAAHRAGRTRWAGLPEMQVLLESVPNGHEELLLNYSPLFYSVTNQYLAMTKSMLTDCMVDLGTRSWGVQPLIPALTAERLSNGLWYAIFQGEEDTVELLLKRGVAVDGWFDGPDLVRSPPTPLSLALHCKCHGIAELLLDYGAKTNYRMQSNSTPLTWAIRKKDERLVLKMLRSGADPNLPDAYAQPLLLAVTQRNAVLTRLLLDFGADPNLTSRHSSQEVGVWHDRWPIVAYAMRRGNQDVVDTLRAFGSVDG